MHGRSFGRALAAMALAAGLAMFATSAAAAPQALALVKTDEPIPLRCHGAVCEAEFSSFCLQFGRFSPKPGTPYQLAEGSDLAVTGTSIDGRARRLRARPLLYIESARRHTAVRISIPRADLQRLKLRQISVTVADNVTLAPLTRIDGDVAIDFGELAMVEESLRPLGSRMVDRDSERMIAARMANRLINALPPKGRVSQAQAVWRQVLNSSAAGAGPMATKMARNAYELCSFQATHTGTGDLRGCMQGQHDRLMDVLNTGYWKAVETGS
ncbi:MAG: hypothetical protein QF582_04660 [Alphaproteobacteria bacterium]|nr:hypothetical protein [Alphaproteobacteria bacterium]MDP6812480.1 hypothetical protein [Alphaproteobacteria bacterium]